MEYSAKSILKSDVKKVLDVNYPMYEDVLNGLSALIHKVNIDKGFWENPRNFGEMIALVHSELSEAIEYERKSIDEVLLSDHIEAPGVMEEIADSIIRLLDLAHAMFGYFASLNQPLGNVSIGQVLVEKLYFNISRPHKHGKAY